MRPNFNMENLRRDKKTTDQQLIKNVHYEEQKPNTRFYLVQIYQSFLNHLTNTFHFQLLTFFFQSTLGVHIKLNLGLFLNPHKKKICFYTNLNRFKIEKLMNEKSSHSFLRKSIENLVENLNEILLENKQPQREKGIRSTRMTATIS